MDKPLLELRKVGLSFGERQIFRDVDLVVQEGEIAVITGESGVGKTSLLRAILGIVPFEGEILLNGKAVESRNSHVATDHAVLVTQQANLWDHLTAQDNVALIRRLLHGESRKEARSHANALLASLEAEKIGCRYPFRLSGGEQQRVSIARGLAAEKPMLLLDEVTANIDVHRRGLVIDALKELRDGSRSVLLVTHDLATASALVKRPYALTEKGIELLAYGKGANTDGD